MRALLPPVGALFTPAIAQECESATQAALLHLAHPASQPGWLQSNTDAGLFQVGSAIPSDVDIDSLTWQLDFSTPQVLSYRPDSGLVPLLWLWKFIAEVHERAGVEASRQFALVLEREFFLIDSAEQFFLNAIAHYEISNQAFRHYAAKAGLVQGFIGITNENSSWL